VDLRSKIERAAGDEQDCAAMLKDSHLIEAALVTDRTVISLDETARELFTLMAQSVGEIKNVVWVNPDKDEQPINWLEEGAKPEKNRRLDFGM
jgi:ABC-type iron transport system FetAB ATPase subunit